MKHILILNGSPRKNGKTASLVNAFCEGARESGNEVVDLYLDSMNIHGCKACEACRKNGGNCVQRDQMVEVYEAVERADVVVFASPMYWGSVTGQLKVVVDRLYAECNKGGLENFGSFMKETAFIMTARGNYYEDALDFYHIFTRIMGWKDWGQVLGAGHEEEARALGAHIK